MGWIVRSCPISWRDRLREASNLLARSATGIGDWPKIKNQAACILQRKTSVSQHCSRRRSLLHCQRFRGIHGSMGCDCSGSERVFVMATENRPRSSGSTDLSYRSLYAHNSRQFHTCIRLRMHIATGEKNVYFKRL